MMDIKEGTKSFIVHSYKDIIIRFPFSNANFIYSFEVFLKHFKYKKKSFTAMAELYVVLGSFVVNSLNKIETLIDFVYP